MKIVVNNIAASSGGAISILKSFYNYLLESGDSKENEWIFLLSGKYIEETDNIKVLIFDTVKKNWLNRLKFDLWSGRNSIAELKPDAVFSLQNTIIFGLKCPQFLYMHQSIPFQRVKKFSFFKSEERVLAIYQYIIGQLIKESIKKADKTIVQTKWIRDAVIESTNLPPNKIKVVLPHIENITHYRRGNQSFQINKFFYPAAKSAYKNHKCIYDACKLLRGKGITDFNITLTIENETNDSNISFLGKIPFELVLEKYNTSSLIFPSYIETVGLPLIEAKQIGTLILASDCPFSKEVLDGYENAYFFDPFKPHELAELIQKVISGEITKKHLVNIDDYNNSCNSWKDVCNLILNSEGML